MLKAVIFDMDGVIVDSEPLHSEVEQKLFKDLGLDISVEERHSFVGTGSREMWSRIKDKYALTQTVEELIAVERNSYLNRLTLPGAARPIPGVAELIENLHSSGVKLVLASSSSMENIDIVLRMFDLGRYFATKVSGDDVPSGKPAPDIFLRAAERAGVQPEECVVIEDSKNGVAAAQAAGMKCIGFRNPNSGDQDLSAADMVIANFSEICVKRKM